MSFLSQIRKRNLALLDPNPISLEETCSDIERPQVRVEQNVVALRVSYDTSKMAIPSLFPAALLHFDAEAFDLLVQRRERDAEELRGLGLVPVAAFQSVGDDAALDLLHHVKE